MMNIKTILAENKKRLKEKAFKYDPLKGVGSPIERKKLYFDKSKYILIPKKMAQERVIAQIIECGSISTYAEKHNIDSKIVEQSIIKLRFEYDFEYWCAAAVKVQDKQTKRIVPLIMRSGQRKLFKLFYSQMVEERPIRVIILKARQWGGSTLVQIFMAWIQLFHRKLWHSVIVADIEEQSRNIRAMYSRMAQYHPKELLEVSFSSFEGSTKNRKIDGRDSVIYLGSMQRPDSLRSADVMMAHISEIGLWHSTEGKTPEDVVQSIAGTVPLEPYSMIIMESTAKGIGNYFHRQWTAASTSQNGYTPLFVAWFDIEMYSLKFKNSKEQEDFAATLNEDEQEQFRVGATLEAINWYRHKMHSEGYDKWRMCCEFPTTPSEAFQSTGRRAHSLSYVAAMRKYCSAPLFIGDMFADSPHGKEAIDSSLHFSECNGGSLWLWAKPDKSISMKRRYVVSMDIGGRTKDADWSVISIIDRYWLSQGGVEECIGTCRFHLDQDLAVWKAVQIAKYFNNALLVVEANSLDAKSTEGDHTLTILDEIKELYTNIYCRTDPQRIKEGAAERFGFYTTRASKTDLVNQMNRRLREEGYIERDSRALDEIDMYEIKLDGTYGAVDGEHDDIYMSRAIALKASQIEQVPVEI